MRGIGKERRPRKLRPPMRSKSELAQRVLGSPGNGDIPVRGTRPRHLATSPPQAITSEREPLEDASRKMDPALMIYLRQNIFDHIPRNPSQPYIQPLKLHRQPL